MSWFFEPNAKSIADCDPGDVVLLDGGDHLGQVFGIVLKASIQQNEQTRPVLLLRKLPAMAQTGAGLPLDIVQVPKEQGAALFLGRPVVWVSYDTAVTSHSSENVKRGNDEVSYSRKDLGMLLVPTPDGKEKGDAFICARDTSDTSLTIYGGGLLSTSNCLVGTVTWEMSGVGTHPIPRCEVAAATSWGVHLVGNSEPIFFKQTAPPSAA